MPTVNPMQEAQQTATLNEQARAPAAKTQRVLACVLCQQRKVKCDRKFPCINCIRSSAQCVPAINLGPRQRRRRFPERELLERLRRYEDLLRQNSIDFEPLHPPTTVVEYTPPRENGRDSSSSVDAQSGGLGKMTSVKPQEAVYKAKDLWSAIKRVTLDPNGDDKEGGDDDDDNTEASFFDDEYDVYRRDNDTVVKNAWTRRFRRESVDQTHNNLLFSAPRTNFHLSTLHPSQVQIFRLWQIYLDKVNPLLKVTHTPTLQPRIIEAASDVANIDPTLQALLFSIYCVSIMSLADNECFTLFRSPKKDLLAGYKSACHQALLECGAWSDGDIDSLTALYLYLLSIRSQEHPRSLSSGLAVAMRNAQRMGMHLESTYTGCTAFEAEMRRRLWWSLVIFDHRICEMSDYKTTTLVPTWDCRTLLNTNDFEIRSDMKNSPTVHERPAETIFAVVRSEIADFIRHSSFHLNFVNPLLNTIAQSRDAHDGPIPGGDKFTALEKRIEDKYLAFCTAENPLHYMTTWTTRGSIARIRLLEHYSIYSTSSIKPTEARRRAALSDALSMLECDTKLRSSPLTQGFLWHVDLNFPALGYLHILNGLTKQPADNDAEKAWDAMNDNYEAVAKHPKKHEGDEPGVVYRPFYVTFSQVVLQAWEAREALLRQQGKPPEPTPPIVLGVREEMKQTKLVSEHGDAGQPNSDMTSINTNNFPMSVTSMDFDGLTSTEGEQSFTGPGPTSFYPTTLGQSTMDVDTDQFWTEIDWSWTHAQSW